VLWALIFVSIIILIIVFLVTFLATKITFAFKFKYVTVSEIGILIRFDALILSSSVGLALSYIVQHLH
jgi:hypothetical protein